MLQSSRPSVSLMCDAAMTQVYYILGTQGSLALERAAQHDILSALAFGSVTSLHVHNGPSRLTSKWTASAAANWQLALSISGLPVC